jgi:PAS domain S-box-containing protein
MSAHSPEERVLICAPMGQDAMVMGSILTQEGFLAEVCANLAVCAERIPGGVGVLVLTGEALQQREVSRLLESLEGQPPWSELPIVILSSHGEEHQLELLRLLASSARSVTLLERPMHRAVLLSSVQVALHSRRRQYQVRDLLREQRERASRQQALYNLVDCLNRAESLTEIYEVALDSIVAATHCHRTSILLFDNAGAMRFKAWRGLSHEYRKATEGHSPWTREHVEPNPILIENIENSVLGESLRAVVRKEGIAALSFFPLLHQRKLLGKFMVYYDAPRVLTEEEMQAARSIANQLGTGIARKQTEEALREREERLRLAMDAADLGSWEWNIRTNAVVWSPETYKLFQVPRTTPVTLDLFVTRVHPDDLDANRRELSSSLHTGKYHNEFRVLLPDGTIRWMLGRGRMISDSQGPNGRMLGVVADVTERKQAEEALARSEQQLRLITDATPALICYIDAEARYGFVNRQHENWVGRPRAEYLGATMSEVLGEETARKFRPYVDRVLAGKAAEFEIQAPHRDLGLRWLEMRYIPHQDAAEKVVGFYVLGLDITNRKAAEQALLLARKRYAALVATMTSIVWTSNPSGEFVSPQPLWEEFTGQSWDDYQGFGWADAVHPDDRQRVKQSWINACEARTLFRASGRLWHAPSQSYRSFEAQAVPLLDADGVVCEWVGCVTDVHARKSVEFELAQTQKKLKQHAANLEQMVAERTVRLTEAIGELESWSYSIAHDMRAPLRSMQGFSQLLRESYAGKLDATADNYLLRIATSAERLDSLIQDVLNYSKLVRGDWPIEQIDPQSLIEEMLATYPNLQAPHADIQVEGRLPKVWANQAGLTQVVSNLLGNAVKFVKPGVFPRVRVRAEEKDGWVRLWFEDNGIGIEKESLGRIFHMFQRLNRPELYEGTGMGLAIVSKAVDRMGGTLGVESEPGQGSRFWVQLKGASASPIVPETAETAAEVR